MAYAVRVSAHSPVPEPSPSPQAAAGELRYLSAADVERCLPAVDARVDLAAQAMLALARDEAEMPPKIGVHPRPGALLHAMPAWLRGPDLVGLKWVAAFPDNRRLGLPAISGLIVLNDAETGVPAWIMDAALITAVRTAAVSGLAVRLFARGPSRRVAILGAGVQARSHLEVVTELLPSAEVAVFDRHPERAAGLAAEHNETLGGDRVAPAATVADALEGADVVVTVATLGASAEPIRADMLAHGALVVAVDFATYVPADLAASAAEFVVDDRAQFLYYRDTGYFPGYREPTATLGEALGGKTATAERGGRDGHVLVTHLGVGLADVLFADAVRREAERLELGVELPR